MPGIFNSAIFNNKVFNTGLTQAAPGGKSDNGAWRKSYNEAMFHIHEHPRLEQIRLEKERAERDLKRNERKLEKVEASRLEALADARLQKQLLDIMNEINALNVLKQNLIHEMIRLREEEDILILLLSYSYSA